MDRRTFLTQVVTLGGAAFLPNWVEQTFESFDRSIPRHLSVPDRGRRPNSRMPDGVVDGIKRADGVTFETVGAFEEYLREAGLAVERLEEADPGDETSLELQYLVEEAVTDGDVHSVGVIAGGYAALVRGEYDGDRLVASMLAPTTQPFGEFVVRTEWADAYNEDEMSASEYGRAVLQTLDA